MSKIIKEERVYDGYFKVDKFTVEDNGKTLTKECFERGDAVAALVYNPTTDKFILTEQFRIGARKPLIEIVAGTMDVTGESPIDTLKREVIEELGYEMTPKSEIYLGGFYVSPGGASEKVHLFTVEVTNKVSEGGGVEDENINIVELSSDELVALYREGKIEDLKTFAAITFLQSLDM